MPRKAFNADVEAASTKSIPGVISVRKGDDDGDVTVVFAPQTGAPFDIALLALDVSGYPSENTFMIFTQSSEVPDGVNEVLEEIASISAGMEISELIAGIAQRLLKSLATGSSSDPFDIDDDSDEEMADNEEEPERHDLPDQDENDYDDADFLSDDDDFDDFKSFDADGAPIRRMSAEAATKLNKRIRADLRAAKSAGFKLGILCGLNAESQTGLLSISIQVSKLGLSNEVLQAWDLTPQRHIVLLVRYASGYKTFEGVITEPAKSLDVSFRIGVCHRYKPSPLEAMAAFADVAKGSNSPQDGDNDDVTRFSGLFISSSLNEFLNDAFVSLVKIRTHAGIGWDGAKLFYKNHRGRPYDATFEFTAEYYKERPPAQSSLPEMTKADHLSAAAGSDVSFPLVAAQFAMRYLLRCTEFCLVCHDRLPGDFEALKPYVCSNPLCLYQYMSLGFGPSLEHEILTQPFVVDLLVSLCYTAANKQKIREYPTGMCLMIPPITASATHLGSPQGQGFIPTVQPPTPMPHIGPIAALSQAKPRGSKPGINLDYIEVGYDHSQKEIIFKDDCPCPVRNGDWVVVSPAGYPQLHHRVMDISLYPTIKLSEFGLARSLESSSNSVHARQPTPKSTSKSPFTPTTTPPPSAIIAANMTVYNKNFDDMDNVTKADAIVLLLETLPSIKDIRAYLFQQSRVTEPNLRSWKERITPAALGLLRWIIASNRSCIVQVEKCPGHEETETSKRIHEKCSNVPNNWVQFHFAQGAPDKEQRFLQSLKDQQSILNRKYPTLFAFHGSAVYNWHSIIRHGLDFKEVVNGRAYGNGVYHSLEQVISNGYASSSPICWPQSDLKISAVMSLNEIVNCPAKFQSAKPHIVVDKVDWIQCRYLLVQSAAQDIMEFTQTTKLNSKKSSSPVKPTSSAEIAQDPEYTAKTLLNKPLGVPECAVSVSKAFRTRAVDNKESSKSRKRRRNSLTNDTSASDCEDPEDLQFLFSEEESASFKAKRGKDELVMLNPKKKTGDRKTDFIPGSLDQSELPILDPPSYATPSATMRLNKELQAVLKVQTATPLHELGWYIDVELVTNVYQWIVELHSFDPSLPLARDMKTAGLTSIVLEIRFGKDYPHSPPFVRVIKPRFLPFTRGGGGHVTGGGAMCMELLTNSGWSAVSSIESVLLQVRMAIMNLEPTAARLENPSKGAHLSYSTREAMDAYIRACRAHGWQVPKDFQEFGTATSAGRSEY